MTDIRLELRKGRVRVSRGGRVLVDADSPGDGDWLWSLTDGAWIRVAEPWPQSPRGIVLRLQAPNRIKVLSHPDPCCWGPMTGVTLDECEAWVAGLSAAQLRRALAWLIYQQREQLPEDVRRAIPRE